MLRVYNDLKGRVVTGQFAPGERLDPSRLASDLGASTTPVRDALHRLSGERLIDSLVHEGFRQPHLSEGALRDLNDWSNDLLHLIARAVARRREGPPGEKELETTRTGAADCFRWLASLSPNREHVHQIANLVDRLALYRSVEGEILPSEDPEVAALSSAIAMGDWNEAGRALDHYHRRRNRIVADVVETLRRLNVQR